MRQGGAAYEKVAFVGFVAGVFHPAESGPVRDLLDCQPRESRVCFHSHGPQGLSFRRVDPCAPLVGGENGLNSTLDMVLPGGSICPAGLTFDFEGNLYANTQPFTGVYKIVKVQHCKTQIPVSKVPLGELNGSATALTVLPATSTSSTGGAAIFFSNSGGNLLFVGQIPDQVLFSSALD